MKKICILFLAILTLYSCGVNRVYTPANYGASKKYIAKPIYTDKNVSAKYASLSISDGKHPYSDEEQEDTKVIGTLHYHQTTTTNKFNYYYGLGLSYGNFNFRNSLNDVIKRNETQNFYSINPKIGGSFKKSKPNIDFHYIGLELNYTYENGSYHDKLAAITPSSSIRVVNPESLFSFNLFSEVLFKLNQENTFGMGIFVGNIIGLNKVKYNIEDSDGGSFGGFTFSYRYKKATFSIVTESGSVNIESVNYGFTYQF